jgi:hypothetical protein
VADAVLPEHGVRLKRAAAPQEIPFQYPKRSRTPGRSAAGGGSRAVAHTDDLDGVAAYREQDAISTSAPAANQLPDLETTKLGRENAGTSSRVMPQAAESGHQSSVPAVGSLRRPFLDPFVTPSISAAAISVTSTAYSMLLS